MKKPLIQFDAGYSALAAALLFTEVTIALYAHDDFVRPYLGDVLVVIFLYCAVKSLVREAVFTPVFLVLLFAYGVETLQYFDFVGRIGLRDSRLANVIMGNYFTWTDMLCYTAGSALVLLLEYARRKQPASDPLIKQTR